MLVLGGGGYTIRNVARCWTFETGVLLNEELPDDLPFNDYLEYFGPEYRLHFRTTNMENMNSREYLEKCKYVSLAGLLACVGRSLTDGCEHRMKILENLRNLPHAPSVPISAPAPPPLYMEEGDDDGDPEVRMSRTLLLCVSLSLFVSPSHACARSLALVAERDIDAYIEHPADLHSEFDTQGVVHSGRSHIPFYPAGTGPNASEPSSPPANAGAAPATATSSSSSTSYLATGETIDGNGSEMEVETSVEVQGSVARTTKPNGISGLPAPSIFPVGSESTATEELVHAPQPGEDVLVSGSVIIAPLAPPQPHEEDHMVRRWWRPIRAIERRNTHSLSLARSPTHHLICTGRTAAAARGAASRIRPRPSPSPVPALIPAAAATNITRFRLP